MELEIMMVNIRPYSKPLIARLKASDTPQLLKDHLKDVLEKGKNILQTTKFTHFFKDIKDIKLWEAGFIFHDTGKAEFSIQDCLYERKKPSLSHTHLSVIFYYSWARDYTEKDLYDLLADPEIRIITFGILSHHSPPHSSLDLNIFKQLFNREINIAEEIFEILSELDFFVDKKTFCDTYKEFVNGYKCNSIEFPYQGNITSESRQKFVLFYNALVKSDWYSAIEEPLNFKTIPSDFATKILDPQRSEVHKFIADKNKFNENILLELPTGYGKTYLGLGYALKTGRQRIIYTLPVTTIIEDVYLRIKEKAGNEVIGWYTSKYLVSKYSQGFLDEIDEKQYIETKYLEKPIIITTLDQILLAFLGIDRYPLKEASLYNSCVILDEPQLYSPFMLLLFSKFVKDYKDYMNFIVMTATLPKFFKDSLHCLITNPFENQKQEIFSRFNRIYFDINYLGVPSKNDEFLKELIDRVKYFVENDKKRVIVLFNTVEKAQTFYKQLPDNIKKFIMHARYIYKDRFNRVSELKLFLQKPGVVVTTQVIEAGVDVSCDIMFREIAPFDSLLQSAGRVNRFSENPQPCPVFIFGSVEEDYLPYKKDFLKITEELLTYYIKNNKIKNESDLYDILDEYWERMSNYIGQEKEKAERIYKAVKDLSPFSLSIEEEKIDLRDTYLKVSVIPIKFYDHIKRAIERYKEIPRENFLERRKVLAEIESYMVEVPFWGKVGSNSFKDYIKEDEHNFKFISLKYDDKLGLLPEEEILIL